MTNEDRTALLGSAAKSLAWDLYLVAECSRSRARVDVERFDRELRSALRKWNAVHKNLNRKKGSAP
jgi:hypothetical protein